MIFLAHLIASLSLCTPAALAALTTITPTPSIAYTIGVPPSTLASGHGPIYLSVSFPASYAYVALGLGTRMADATIFAVYPDGAGNVTVSARTATGHMPPLANPGLQAGVTVLGGSGAEGGGGSVTANWEYVASDKELGGGETSFIASWKGGEGARTGELDVGIAKHDGVAVFVVELGRAEVGEGNPFLGTAVEEEGGEGEGEGQGTGGGEGEGQGEGQGEGEGEDQREGQGAEGTEGTQVGQSEEVLQLIARMKKFAIVHGALMGVAWVVLLPVGAMLMRSSLGGVWTHAALQTLGLAMIVAGFAVGYDLAGEMHLLFNNTHTIFGAAIFALVLAQPVLGLVHHARFRVTRQKTAVGLVHRWYGRGVIVLAVVNGGLGLQLAANTTGGVVAYAVVAGVVGMVYAAVLGFTAVVRRKGVVKVDG